MAKRKPLTDKEGEVREWTAEDFDRAVSFSKLPESLQRKLLSLKARPGTQTAQTKKQISIRLSRDVLDQMQATGQGWQLHVEEAIREWLAKDSKGRRAAS